MFPQQQQQQPQIRTYNPQEVANAFYQNISFNLGHPYDNLSVPIATMLVNEIQSQALAKGHPVRVGMFNIMQANDFNNQMFKDLLQLTMIRLAHSCVNREFGDLNACAPNVISRVVRACAGSMAITDQGFMQTMPADVVKDINEGNQIWQHLLRLMRGQEQYIPFNQLALSNQFPVTSPTTSAVMALANTIQNTETNLFNVSGQTNFTGTVLAQNANNAEAMGPYAAKNARRLAMMQGSMQAALTDLGLAPSTVGVDHSIVAAPQYAKAAVATAPAVAKPAIDLRANRKHESEWGVVFVFPRNPNAVITNDDGMPDFTDGGPPRNRFERTIVRETAVRLGLNPDNQDYGPGFDYAGQPNFNYYGIDPLYIRMREANGGVGVITFYDDDTSYTTTPTPTETVPASNPLPGQYQFIKMDDDEMGDELPGAEPAYDPLKDPKSLEHAKKFSFAEATVAGRTYYMMATLPDDRGAAEWKPSSLQPVHPGGSKKVGVWRYAICQCGTIVYINYNQKREQTKMDYDAHGMDPTKGQPAGEAAVVEPVVEEAAQYSTDINVSIDVINVPTVIAVEDTNSAIRTACQAAALSDENPDVMTKQATVNTTLFYDNANEADDDIIVVNTIGTCGTFVKAIELMKQITNREMFDLVNKQLTAAVLNAMCNELSMPVEFDSFFDDCGGLIDAVEGQFGQFFSEKLREQQPNILMTYANASSGVNMADYANSVLTSGNEEDLPESKLAKIVFLTHNVVVARIKYTDESLALTDLRGTACSISINDFPVMYRMMEATVKAGTAINSEFYLVTRDGVRYRVHVSAFGVDEYLLSKAKV